MDTFQICRAVRVVRADEQYSEAVEQRKAALMAPGGSHDPLKPVNFEEAIGECLVNVCGGMPQTLTALLCSKYGPYIIARLLLAVATEYMARMASLTAETQVDSEVPA